MRPLLCLALFAAAVLATGCSRARVTTEVKSGGAWTRTVVLAGQAKQEGMQMSTALEDAFDIPSGADWKISEEKKDSDRNVTAVRTFAVGAAHKGDIALKEDLPKPGPGQEPPKGPAPLVVVNDVTVTRLGPKRYEYKETLRWVGPPPKTGNIKPEDIVQLKALLPKALATDENARALGQKAAILAVPILFGPGDPLLAMGLLHPDLALRRASQRMGTVMMKALEEQFGDKMPIAERREVARQLIDTAFNQAKPAKPDPAAGPSPDKGSSGKLTSLMFVLKTAGKIVSSNGEVDDLTGEVFWALFPEAASIKPVTMTAIVELDR